MTSAFSIAAALLYLAAAMLIGRRLARGIEAEHTSRLLPLLLWSLALFLHLPGLLRVIITPEGLNLGIFNVLPLVTDSVALILLLTTLARPVDSLGIFVLPVAAVAALLRLVGTPPGEITVTIASPGLQAHILLSLLAYSLLSIAAVQAALLAVQNRHLRRHRPGGFIRALPPLQTMESLLFQIIGLGYVLLTLALATGFLYLEDMFAQHLVHKTVLSLFAWGLFSILLWGRWHFGWRGRTAIRWTLGGFVLLMLAYFGSKLVLELILGS